MKEIGAEFKAKREEIGVSLEEVSTDLNITIPQLENLENGSVNAFKDIFFLKELIKKYATYLNLDEDEIMEGFNDFVFDYTSRIPIEEIEERVKEIVKEEDIEYRKKINSPYTQKKVRKAKMKPIYLYIIVTVILITTTILIVNAVIESKSKSDNVIGYITKGD